MTNYQDRITRITDMIRGEINRMCVTDSPAELEAMRWYAVRNLNQLRELRQQQLKEKGERT